MIPTSISALHRALLVPRLLLFCLGLAGFLPSRLSATTNPTVASFVTELEAQIEAALNNADLAPAARQKRIAAITRTLVSKSSGGVATPEEQLSLALQLTERATQLAPQAALAIVEAVSVAPVVARHPDGPARLRELADKAAIVATRTEAPARSPSGSSGLAIRPAQKRGAAPSQSNGTAQPPRSDRALPNTHEVADSTSQSFDTEATPGRIRLGDNTHLALLANVGIARDDNIFLTAEDEIADTIVTLTPGFAFTFGQASLLRGSLRYRHAFLRYIDENAPNATLASGSADFGYTGSRVNILASASYRQINQNNIDTGGFGQQIFRRDLAELGVTTETNLTAKTSLQAGAIFSSTRYRSEELIGTREFALPLNFYLALTPKTSLSSGVSVRWVRPNGATAGPSSQDLYYNVGIRGSLAPKLTGELRVGYRTRNYGGAHEEGEPDDESLLGFDGSLNLALTPKSSLGLALDRDFGTGALGESIASSRYSLSFTTNPTLQWSFAATLSYLHSSYGPVVFSLPEPDTELGRQDHYWEGSLLASYAFTRWFSASADYTLRDNNSSDENASFANNLINLNLGFRY